MGSLRSESQGGVPSQRRRWLGGVLLGALVATGLAADESWRGKAPEQWTQEEAESLLSDSPWAREVTLYQLSGRLLGVLPDGRKVIYQEGPRLPPRQYSVQPVSLEPERVPAKYVVRWSSAEIVQRALARLREISSVLAAMQGPPPELSAEHIVLTARVAEPPAETGMARFQRPMVYDESGRPTPDEPPTVEDLFAGLEEEELAAAAELRLAGGRRLKPERVLQHGLGTSEGISFFFPRQQEGRATLPPETKWAEFVFAGSRGSELKAKFRLEEMRVGGQPDY